MFERRREPIASPPVFRRRVAHHALIASAIVGVSLVLGALGYHALAGLPWIDALLNAAMLLTGMGPVTPLTSAPAKLFATAYALYSGIAFLATTSVLVAPFLHRLLHRLHWE